MSGSTPRTFVEFHQGPNSASQKTLTWEVRTVGGILIGAIKWYPSWRAYSFFPEPNCVFERHCLRLIATFCELRTEDKRRVQR